MPPPLADAAAPTPTKQPGAATPGKEDSKAAKK